MVIFLKELCVAHKQRIRELYTRPLNLYIKYERFILISFIDIKN